VFGGEVDHQLRIDPNPKSIFIRYESALMEPGPVDEPTVAATPPMGWNSWTHFSHQIDAQLVREIADAMVESGMRDAGYEYVNLDDLWMAPKRDGDGRLQPDPIKFPDGIEPVAEYVHDRGLKLGIYSDAGIMTCQGFPGSLMYEQQDAEAFAEWGVDLLKYDNCFHLWGARERLLGSENVTWEDFANGVAHYHDTFDETEYADAIDLLAQHDDETEWAKTRYRRMGDALQAVDRDILYSVCCWGLYDIWEWGEEIGAHMWRTTGDISPHWEDVMDKLDQQVDLAEYAGPGGWNDPENLQVGQTYEIDAGARTPEATLSLRECRAHISMWAMLAAPLLAGTDLRHMSDEIRGVLTNDDVIAIDQDPAGNQATRRVVNGDSEVWARELANGDVAVALLNRGATAAAIDASPGEVGLEAPDTDAGLLCRDCWTGDGLASDGPIASHVPSHGVTLFRVTAGPVDAAPPLVAVDAATVETAPDGAVDCMMTMRNHGRIAAEQVTLEMDDEAAGGDGVEVGSIAAQERVEVTITVPPARVTDDDDAEVTIDLSYVTAEGSTDPGDDAERMHRPVTVDLAVCEP